MAFILIKIETQGSHRSPEAQFRMILIKQIFRHWMKAFVIKDTFNLGAFRWSSVFRKKFYDISE